MNKPGETYNVPAVVTSIQILRYLETTRAPAGLNEICVAVNAPRSSGLNVIRTLLQHGLLYQDGETKRYSLGAGLISLGAAAANAMGYVALARPHLQALAYETQLTASLAQRVGGKHITLDKVESAATVRITIEVGHTHPPFTGAVSKAFFAFLPDEEVEQLWRTSPPAPGMPRTASDLPSYRTELARTRERRYGSSIGEFIGGINTLAAPVFDATGSPILALSLIGPQGLLADDRLDHLGNLLWSRAVVLTQAIGGLLPEPLTD